MTLLALVYLACFQLCALPAIVRIRRRKSSADLSVWREWLLMLGASAQLVVMHDAGSPWQVWISPVMTLSSLAVLLWHVYRYRRA